MEFNNKSKKLNAVLVSSLSLIQQFLQTVGSFVYRTIFLMILSKEYLGINSLFSNVLQLFSLAELGIGAAIQYNMYKAFADRNTDRISALLNFYKKVYLSIAAIVLLMGIIFYPFIGSIVDISEIPADVNILLVYFLFVINSVASYLFIYKQSLLYADQKAHIVSLYSCILLVVGYVVRIIILIITKKYDIVLLVDVCVTIILNYLYSLWISKQYKTLQTKKISLAVEEKKEIINNTKALLCHKVGTIVVTGTDNIVISKYISLISVGLYSNYATVVTAISSLSGRVFSSILPIITNYTLERTEKETYIIFKRFLFVNMCLASFTTICLYALINPFILIWLDETFLFPQTTVLVICLQHYLFTARAAANSFVYSYGLFNLDKARPLFEATINLFVSIVLAQKMGITGVFIGTIVSGLLTFFWREPYILFRKGFKFSSREYWKIQTKWVIFTLIVMNVLNVVTMFFTESFLGLVFRFIIVGSVAFILIIMFVIKTEEFKYFLSLFKQIIRKYKV